MTERQTNDSEAAKFLGWVLAIAFCFGFWTLLIALVLN
jgi:hypothetical protein